MPAIVRRGRPPPRLATSEGAIALRSSTVSSRKRLDRVACDFLSLVDVRMKSPRFASCDRSTRRTGMNPSESATWAHPKNAGSCWLLGGCCCTAWIGAGCSLQSLARWPVLLHKKHLSCALSTFGCRHACAVWPLRLQLMHYTSALSRGGGRAGALADLGAWKRPG